MNRNKGGEAWPGIKTIAGIACIDRRTVMRAIKWLEAAGHLCVTRTRKGKRNLANRYLPLLSSVHSMPLRRGIAVSPPRGIAMSPEPYTEPLTEPHIPINISATPGGVVIHEDSQQGKEERGIRGIEGARHSASIESPLQPERQSVISECYRLARDNYGDRGAALVTKALQSSEPWEVLSEIEDAIEAGDDLGHVLWRPQ